MLSAAKFASLTQSLSAFHELFASKFQFKFVHLHQLVVLVATAAFHWELVLDAETHVAAVAETHVALLQLAADVHLHLLLADVVHQLELRLCCKSFSAAAKLSQAAVVDATADVLLLQHVA